MLKSNIAWMKKNVPSDLKVWKGMIQDIDWSQVVPGRSEGQAEPPAR